MLHASVREMSRQVGLGNTSAAAVLEQTLRRMDLIKGKHYFVVRFLFVFKNTLDIFIKPMCSLTRIYFLGPRIRIRICFDWLD